MEDDDTIPDYIVDVDNNLIHMMREDIMGTLRDIINDDYEQELIAKEIDIMYHQIYKDEPMSCVINDYKYDQIHHGILCTIVSHLMVAISNLKD